MRRSRNVRIDARQVQAHARTWVDQVLKLEDHGHKCTAKRVISILLVAASRVCSIAAACRDLADAPSDQALRDALYASLPGIDRLEQQINQTLAWGLPARVLRQRRVIAGDLILIPYYGEPDHDTSERYHSKQKAGTTKFHGYATACVIHEGMRYTVALTRVEKGEKMPAIVTRLVRQVRAAGLKFKVFLLDRGFFTVDVITYLKRARVPFLMPFLMPVAIRGVKAKNRTRRRAELRGFSVKPTGWYEYTFQGKNRQRIHVCVCAKYRHHKKRESPEAASLPVRSLELQSQSVCGARAVPQTVRHRDQLPAGSRVAHPNVLTQAAAASAVLRPEPDSAKRVGVAALHSVRGLPRRTPATPTEPTALPPHAPLDRQRHHHQPPQRLPPRSPMAARTLIN